VLSRRLGELKEAGVIRRVEAKRKTPLPSSWMLTEKGKDLLPVIIRLVAYSARWNNAYKYEGQLPRPISTLNR